MIALVVGWTLNKMLIYYDADILLFPVELYNIHIPELVGLHFLFTLYRKNWSRCMQHVDSWELNSVRRTHTPLHPPALLSTR